MKQERIWFKREREVVAIEHSKGNVKEERSNLAILKAKENIPDTSIVMSGHCKQSVKGWKTGLPFGSFWTGHLGISSS